MHFEEYTDEDQWKHADLGDEKRMLRNNAPSYSEELDALYTNIGKRVPQHIIDANGKYEKKIAPRMAELTAASLAIDMKYWSKAELDIYNKKHKIVSKEPKKPSSKSKSSRKKLHEHLFSWAETLGLDYNDISKLIEAIDDKKITSMKEIDSYFNKKKIPIKRTKHGKSIDKSIQNIDMVLADIKHTKKHPSVDDLKETIEDIQKLKPSKSISSKLKKQIKKIDDMVEHIGSISRTNKVLAGFQKYLDSRD